MQGMKMISFYADKKEHYPISDDFIECYQQKDNGDQNSYITYAKKVGHIIAPKKHEPNQKWHFFEAYFMRKIIDSEGEKIEIKGFRCPELLLWLAEAADVDQNIIKQASVLAKDKIDEIRALNPESAYSEEAVKYMNEQFKEQYNKTLWNFICEKIYEFIEKNRTMNKMISVNSIIEFFSHANEHYPVSDLYMYEYQQKKNGNGYKELEDELNDLIEIKEKDKKFFDTEIVRLMKMYAPLRYFLIPQKGQKITSQKWHFLVAYYLFKECNDNKVKEIEEYKPIDWLFAKGSAYNCPELCLWMVEAAMDGEIITKEDLYKLFFKAVEFKNLPGSHNQWKCYQWWKENKQSYWEKILKVIEKQKNKDL